MNKIIGTEAIKGDIYAKVLVDPTVNEKTWVQRFCYKCDVSKRILICNHCGNFWFNGYFKYIGDGGL